jgi:anhydro-N-acetylmuramic acid kinase
VIEALLFALLAYNTVHGIEGNLPSCTGAKEKVILGKIIPGKNYKSIAFQ